MYPLIKTPTIRKVVRYFAKKLTRDTKKTINLCLDLISFDVDYCEYHGGEIEEQGLAIGGY